MRLTLDEKTYLIQNHKVFSSHTLLMRRFKDNFKKKHAPTYDTVKNIIAKFIKTGSVKDLPKTGRPKTARTEENIKRVEMMLKNKPAISIPRVALSLNLSKTSVYRIANQDLNLFPYKIHLVHELQPGDPERRIMFANWFLSIPGIEKIFYGSDEAYFHLNGAVNNHNFRIWSDSNPHLVQEQPLKPDKILVWCAVSSQRIIGPFFFDETVKGENYLNMLMSYFWPRLYRSKNGTISYFQQDGAPAHRTKQVQAWLKSKFGDRFVKSDLWPARSPDLNPCDYFLWGYLKDKVYASMPQTVEELKEKIKIEIEKIRITVLSRVFENMKKRCQEILEKNGNHIE